MWGHEIIEAMREFQTHRNENWDVKHNISRQIEDLAKRSHYFFFGNLQNVFDFIDDGEPVVNTEHFLTKYKDYLKFPYNPCGFETIVNRRHQSDNEKLAMITKHVTFLYRDDRTGISRTLSCGFVPSESNKWFPGNYSVTWDDQYHIGLEDLAHGRFKFSDEEIEVETGTTRAAAFIAVACLALLNCKNVNTHLIIPGAAIQKKRRRNGKIELIGYRTVSIALRGNRTINISQGGNVMDQNRIHLCRGHFKVFNQDRPLFGKYKGLYWWTPHIRGRNRDGVVLKDYKVKAA